MTVKAPRSRPALPRKTARSAARTLATLAIASSFIPLHSARSAEVSVFAAGGDLFPAGTARLSQQWGLVNTGQSACGQNATSRFCQAGKAGADISAAKAWAAQSDCSGVITAILDTGIDASHPDLAANLSAQRDVSGTGPATTVAVDTVLHGTHVAGIIAATGKTVRGVCARARMMAIKVGDEQGMTDSDIAEGLREAQKAGARVANLSLGGAGYSALLRQTIADAPTMLIVAAAGNENSNNDLFPSYPASYTLSNVIAIAATDNRDGLAGFSNFGKNSVHIGAPGFGILSTLPMKPTAVMTAEHIPAEYGVLDGTSMATPFVTGAAALALTKNPRLSSAQVRQLLMETSDVVPSLATTVRTSARLNLAKLTANAMVGPKKTVTDNSQAGPRRPLAGQNSSGYIFF